MRPAFLDEMSWAMAEVYEACKDRILINLARYFPMVRKADEIKGSFEYQARMLAQMGLVNSETAEIILQSLGGADEALRTALETSILDALKHEEPKLRRAAEKGLLSGPGFLPAEVTPNQMQAFRAYYRQSADKLNLVNTVMLESTQDAYRQTVSDVTSRIAVAQSILNEETGELVTGVTAYNQAVRTAVKRMVDNGITGYVDHGGHRWSPETYAAMDIRTTMFNTARAAIWERAEEYGCDTYQVSSHQGARPLCYPWQGKVISSTDYVRDITDIDGNTVHVYAQSETTYGEPAGLFGINCGHYPMIFIPGFSALRGQPQDPEENKETYALKQEQRDLERRLREEKRDLAVMKAQGASTDEIRAQEQRVADASREIDNFCADNGLPRRRNRETAPVRAEWPGENGTRVTRFDGGYIDVKQVPPKKSDIYSLPPRNVASPATQTAPNVLQSNPGQRIEASLQASGVAAVPVTKWKKTPTQQEIIKEISGADKTSGSCASVALAYVGNKAGYNVHDFRGGVSMDWFSTKSNTQKICELPDVAGTVINGRQEIKIANQLLSSMQRGKEYWLGIGKHASIVRSGSSGYEYLELQSSISNGWHPLDDNVLRWRFGCVARRGHDLPARLMEVDKLTRSKDFIGLLKYLNTNVNKQRKGAGGGIK